MNAIAALRRDDAVEREFARATLQLRRYRLARDRARAARLGQAPYLANLIAEMLAVPAEAQPSH